MIFSLPIILGQVGQMLIGVGDVIVAGRYSTETLAAIGIATGIQSPILLFGIGLLMGISPVLAKLKGQNQSISNHLIAIYIYAFLVSLILVLIQLAFIPLVSKMGFSIHLVPFIQKYLWITGFSLPGIIIYLALKEYQQCLGRIIWPNLLALFAVILNIIGNFILVFGKWGIVPIGEDGLAYMSVIIRWLLALGLIIFSGRINFNLGRNIVETIKSILVISFPIGFAVLAEVLAFSMVTVLVGAMDTIQAATHNIVLTMASVTFMVPLAVSSAASTKVGYAYGQNNYTQIKSHAYSCLIISLSFMSFSAFIYFLFPQYLLSLFTNDPAVIKLGLKLLIVICLFQLFDGAQITLSGILRGLGVAKPVFITTLAGHWLIGFPIGCWLAYSLKMQAHGLWIGLAIGLFIISIILYGIFKLKIKQLTFAPI
jgi:MATE family multidrug resistance protein